MASKATAPTDSATTPAAPVVVIPSNTAPFAFAVQFMDSGNVVYLVREGSEEADETALRAEILKQGGKTLMVSHNGKRFAPETRFTLAGYEGQPLRFIAATK